MGLFQWYMTVLDLLIYLNHLWHVFPQRAGLPVHIHHLILQHQAIEETFGWVHRCTESPLNHLQLATKYEIRLPWKALRSMWRESTWTFCRVRLNLSSFAGTSHYVGFSQSSINMDGMHVWIELQVGIHVWMYGWSHLLKMCMSRQELCIIVSLALYFFYVQGRAF